MGDLDYVDEHYESIGVGAYFSERSLSSVAGRPQGGMGCLWRREADFAIDKVVLDQNMCILCLSYGNSKTVLVNVYLNSDVWEIRTQTEYLENLNKMENILSDYVFDQIYFMGDFNADPFIGRAWGNLKEFMIRNTIRCFDVDSLSTDTITFVSHDSSHCKWFDHIIGRNSQYSQVRNVKVHDDLIGSDHFPISAVIFLDNSQEDIPVNKLWTVSSNFVDWQCLKDEELQHIESHAMLEIGNFLDYNATCCHTVGCMNKSHINQIKLMYEKIISSIYVGSRTYVKERKKKDKFKVIPGWNRRVKSLYAVARENYLRWVEEGRGRNSLKYAMMIHSKKMFKDALNDCKKNENQEICNSIEEKYKSKHFVSFWKDVKRKKIHTKKSNIIDGKSDVRDVIKIFSNKFLQSENEENIDELRLINRVKCIWNSTRKLNLQISASTLKKYCLNLKCGMGHDGIHSIFLKNVSETFLENFAHFLNSCFSHCHFPDNLLMGDINPTIKNLKGNVMESSNYRPVMQSSCLLKVVEMHILNVLEEKIDFNFRQFGFKKGSSTADACLVLKEIVHSYTKTKGKVFAAFVDLSKAFDRVDHC